MISRHKGKVKITESKRIHYNSIGEVLDDMGGANGAITEAQALNDFTSYIVDYWNSSDDNPQQSVLDAIVDLGVELGTRKKIAEDNVRLAKEEGYDQFYAWKIKRKDGPFVQPISLFTKQLDLNEANVQTEQKNDHVEQESAQIVHKNAQDE